MSTLSIVGVCFIISIGNSNFTATYMLFLLSSNRVIRIAFSLIYQWWKQLILNNKHNSALNNNQRTLHVFKVRKTPKNKTLTFFTSVLVQQMVSCKRSHAFSGIPLQKKPFTIFFYRYQFDKWYLWKISNTLLKKKICRTKRKLITT